MISRVAVASLKGISLSHLLPGLASPICVHVCKSQVLLALAQAETRLPPPRSADESEPIPRVVQADQADLCHALDHG